MEVTVEFGFKAVIRDELPHPSTEIGRLTVVGAPVASVLFTQFSLASARHAKLNDRRWIFDRVVSS